jgi:hypothetical protein
MGGFAVRSESEGAYISSIQVEPMDLLDLFERGELAWPEFEDSEIDARTQADVVVKSIALSQLIWFIAQIIGRTIDGCAVTTLELFTLSNVLCSVVTYIVWWEKPYGVRAPIILDIPTSYELTDRGADFFGDADVQNTKCRLAGVCVGISFGALHLLAWRFHFPSETERLLWQICSVGIIITSVYLPIAHLWTIPFEEYLVPRATRLFDKIPQLRDSGFISRATDAIFLLPLGFYLIFRLYMLVEMFAAFRDVPQDVYTTIQWTQYFPAFG